MASIVQIVGDGRPGGGTTVVLTLSSLLAARGEDVVIITQRGTYLVSQARLAGLQVVELDFASRSKSLVLAAQFTHLFRKLQPAIVHAHGARAGIPAALVPRQAAGRLVYTVHGFHFLHKLPLIYRLAHAAEAFCIARAHCTVFVSDSDFSIAKSSQLLRRSRAQRIIKNAVEIQMTRLGGQTKKYDIAFLGRLHPQKNPLILVDILKAMLPARPSLCVIGGGTLAGELASRIAKEELDHQIFLHGECDRSEALEMLSACRVLMLPSVWEGHPLTLIEAMHLGVPAVASDIPGNNEIIIDGQTGYLVRVDDVHAYAERAAALLADADLCRRMGTYAQRNAEQNHSVDRMLDAHLEVYGRGSRGPEQTSQSLPDEVGSAQEPVLHSGSLGSALLSFATQCVRRPGR